MFRVRSCLIFIFFCFHTFINSQTKVTYYSEDSLKITADLYLKDYGLPFILLFHRDASSRGEYSETAKKLTKLDYNCLAVDLRKGKKYNYVSNETASRAREEKIPDSYLDAWKDIKASLNFIKKFTPEEVILFGSSYSASICLLEASNNPDIDAVIAFSPGEYFLPDFQLEDSVWGIKVPVFIYATPEEYNFVKQMLSGVDNLLVQYYVPQNDEIQGAEVLNQNNETASECWLELLMFFKRIRGF